MNKKVQLFEEYIEEEKLNFFTREDLNDVTDTSIYRATMEVKRQELPTMLVLNNKMLSTFNVRIAGKCATDSNVDALVRYCNTMNRNYKLFKYCVNAEGDLVLEICITAADEYFDPKVVHAIITLALKNLEENYASIMKVVWDN